MNKASVVAVSLLLFACSSASSGTHAPTGPCAARSGSYLKHIERAGAERASDCGPGADAVITVSAASAATAQSPCKDTSVTSANNCSITVDETCRVQPSGEPPANYREAGTVTWDEDGTYASGTVQITLTELSGAVICTAPYRVTLTRQ